jgi:hypothetical protein
VIDFLAASDVSDSFAQYGSLGALASALVAGQLLVLRYVLSPERERANRLEAEVARLNETIQDKTIPALVEATRVVSESQVLLRDIQREREMERREREVERDLERRKKAQ